MKNARSARARTTTPRPLDVDTLWQLQRVGSVALAPDGRRAVCAVTTPDMEKNTSSTALWLLDTTRAAPRALTRCGDKDGQPAWSPRGDAIAFVARRGQQGQQDKTPQLYRIAPDGGEAERISDHAPGIEHFRWLPDGRRIVFAAWVWPELRGAAAQARRWKTFSERKETGYATSEAYYRYWDHEVPMGRVLHLLLLDTRTGRVTDLFEGTALQLPRDTGDCTAYAVHPDGRRVAFQHDPAPVQRLGNRLALSEIEIGTRRVRALVDDAAWDCSAPAYSPDGRRLAFLAAHVGAHHTAPQQLALRPDDGGRWQLLDAAWDHEAQAPLRWSADGSAVHFAAEARGRCHLWRATPADRRIVQAHAGGWVQGFDLAGDTLLLAADAALHPTRVYARHGGGATVRLERFNDTVLAGVALGDVREVEVTGALGEPVQLWLTFPPGFDAKKRHPVQHVIHGGPFTAAGDSFGWRWNPHVFASAGQVVAQVNFHGSSGFGWAFKRSLIGRQGMLELQDIEAATDWLLRQRWVDGRRITASGGSYGGFLVAWMNGHVAAGRYQGYVCHAGVYDRIATFSADSYPVRPKDLGALYWEDMGHVLAQSPHAHAAHMHTPTLVIHGARDYRVPDCNGLAYYNTLQARGVRSRLLWFPDENHWVLKPRNSRLWYTEFMAWIAACSAPAKPGRSGARA
ncbi:prolyl oligopeptidase family serine peptidase [Rubrivivax sp. RP6-9]|uniref:prolyl oligopeptidase family serine peptidase n=1 Tax=Rubrivivax sp. RP6-9 TaxID=3415750 RepID=UPI003CC6A6DA